MKGELTPTFLSPKFILLPTVFKFIVYEQVRHDVFYYLKHCRPSWFRMFYLSHLIDSNKPIKSVQWHLYWAMTCAPKYGNSILLTCSLFPFCHIVSYWIFLSRCYERLAAVSVTATDLTCHRSPASVWMLMYPWMIVLLHLYWQITILAYSGWAAILARELPEESPQIKWHIWPYGFS